MNREEYISYETELLSIITDNELELNQMNCMRLAEVKQKGSTEEARRLLWDRWWPRMKPVQDRIKSLKDELQYVHFMTLERKYMTQCLHSDANPYEVIEERTDKLWIVRRMKAVETEASRQRRMSSFVPGGFMGHFDDTDQEWDITPDACGEVMAIRRHIDGRWYDSYGIMYTPSEKPYKHYDFNF